MGHNFRDMDNRKRLYEKATVFYCYQPAEAYFPLSEGQRPVQGGGCPPMK